MKVRNVTRNAGGFLVVCALLLSSAAARAQAPAQLGQPPATKSAQQRKDQFAADTAKLLKLATELKAAVDKSTKDQLSIAVVKKADEVEKLAHKLREEMKNAPVN